MLECFPALLSFLVSRTEIIRCSFYIYELYLLVTFSLTEKLFEKSVELLQLSFGVE